MLGTPTMSRYESAEPTGGTHRLVFFLDVDNTLIDNDAVKSDLDAQLERLLGTDRAGAFWSVYEEVRQERDFVDFPHTLERFRAAHPDEAAFPRVAALILCYPYEASLYPRALEAVAHLKTLGGVAIVSDGDPVFQAAKIARAGLADAVDGRVMITVHKERELEELTRQMPAERYVLVDDKPRILSAAKERLGGRLLTVHVCQGRYAHEEEHRAYRADVEVERIADLLRLGARDF